jgi:hypothetical protein
LALLTEIFRALADQHTALVLHGRLALSHVRVNVGGTVALASFDEEETMAPDPAAGRALDLQHALSFARQLLGDDSRARAALEEACAKAGDLGAAFAAQKLARALERRVDAAGKAALEGLARRCVVDREELRALLRDVLGAATGPHDLAEVEAFVPRYLAYRPAIDRAVLREELGELAEEGWATGDFTLDHDARGRVTFAAAVGSPSSDASAVPA